MASLVYKQTDSWVVEYGAFGDTLRDEILVSGKSLDRISRETGIGEDVLDKFVRGKTDLSLTEVERLCTALNLNVMLLTTRERNTRSELSLYERADKAQFGSDGAKTALFISQIARQKRPCAV